MKKAQELYKISKLKEKELIENKLKDIKKIISLKMEKSANDGFTYCTIFDESEIRLKDILIDKYIKIVKEFENQGYKVSISVIDNSFIAIFTIYLSWDNKVRSENHGLLLYKSEVN